MMKPNALLPIVPLAVLAVLVASAGSLRAADAEADASAADGVKVSVVTVKGGG